MNGNTKLNNGYILVLFFRFHDGSGTKEYTRYFGPFVNPIVAIDEFKAHTKLKPKIPSDHWRDGVLRPVLGHMYKVEFSKLGIVAIAIKTQETTFNLALLKNPKD